MVDVAEFLPVAIYPCVALPTISICFVLSLPILILLLEPSSIILPSPNDIEACCELISILFAFNSKPDDNSTTNAPSPNCNLSPPLPLPIKNLPSPST